MPRVGGGTCSNANPQQGCGIGSPPRERVGRGSWLWDGGRGRSSREHRWGWGFGINKVVSAFGNQRALSVPDLVAFSVLCGTLSCPVTTSLHIYLQHPVKHGCTCKSFFSFPLFCRTPSGGNPLFCSHGRMTWLHNSLDERVAVECPAGHGFPFGALQGFKRR